jgi:hypothetical protein
MPPNDFHMLAQIEQFTEIPLQIENVEEELAWMRTWSSWRSANFEGLRLLHLASQDRENLYKTSFLAIEKHVSIRNQSDAENALANFYQELFPKINILSLLTENGFSIKAVSPYTLATQKNRKVKWLSMEYWRNYIDKTSFELSREATLITDEEGYASPQITVGQRKTCVINKDGYFPVSYEVIVDLREKNIGRRFEMVPIVEVQCRWDKANKKILDFDSNYKFVLLRALELFRTAKMIRNVYARYSIIWAALDSLTPYSNKMGIEKTKGMAKSVGQINGVDDINEALSQIYSTRNNIVHCDRKELSFPYKCKKRLLRLEWILNCYVLKLLELPQLPSSLAPKIE